MPNAGKSTLINALVGEKVAIVSWRPQTTRNKILGVVNTDGAQVVLIDTPGIHQAKNKLGRYMMQSVASGLKDVDGVIYVLDAAKGVREEDDAFLSERAESFPVIVALNKQDAVTQETLFKALDKLNGYKAVRAIVPVSAKKGENLDVLLSEAEKLLPEGEKMYPDDKKLHPEGEKMYTDDKYTDRTMRYMAAEIIREKALYLLDKEVPYGIGVNINKFELREDKPIYDIDADVVCEKQSHKAIVIGKGGEMLKKISTAARQDLEELTGCKVFLTLYVRVKAEWRDSDYLMRELGYDVKDLKD